MTKLSEVSVAFDNDAEYATITVEQGEFAGVRYQYRGVSFPDENEPILQYELFFEEGSRVIAQDDPVYKQFEQYTGDLLVEIIQHAIDSQTVHFKGGK